jgi:DNA invertase Pin-like site-specific DNA recombinase
MVDLATLLERAQRNGWELICLDANVDTTTPEGEAHVGMLGVFAQLERRRISARTREALAVARVQGTKSGRPIGRPRAVPRELAKRIQRERRSGLSFSEIAWKLNTEKVPTTCGARMWYPARVRQVVLQKPESV